MSKKAAAKEMTLEELRLSPDRAVWVEGKGWDDRWAAKQHGQKHYYIVPAELEKHGIREEAEKVAAEQGELLPVFVLVSLFDYDKGCMVPAAVKMGFKTDDWYWAKEAVAGDPDFARLVDLGSGRVNSYGNGSSGYVRPVRLSQ